MNKRIQLSGADITTGFDELSRCLRRRNGQQAEIVVVGGSFLALNGLRDSTMDVDSVTRIDAELAQDIQEVAATFGWQTNWLNDNAAMFKPNGIDYDRSAVLYENEVLRVIGPHVDDVFIMKLYAARQVDIPDLVVLWPQVTFQTGSDVVDRYNDAYPAAFHDEYLIEFVQLIIGQASSK